MRKDYVWFWSVTIFVLVMSVGYLLNIYDVVKWAISDQRLVDITTEMVVRIVGIFVPFIGSIMGFI